MQLKITVSKKPEYRAWTNMKQRCYNPSYNKSKNYLGRGIIVCDEWLYSFRTFYEYIGDKPSPKHSLDRINNDGNYEPGNIRWATPSQQSLNSRHSIHSVHNGVYAVNTKKGVHWQILKKEAGKNKCYGTYHTLEEAVIIRNSIV